MPDSGFCAKYDPVSDEVPAGMSVPFSPPATVETLVWMMYSKISSNCALFSLVLAHGDGDDALFARELGREDEHAVSRRGDDGGPFLVEIDVEGFGVGAEVPALDDDLGGYRAGFRVERFEYDGLIGPVARISPPRRRSTTAAPDLPSDRRATRAGGICGRNFSCTWVIRLMISLSEWSVFGRFT